MLRDYVKFEMFMGYLNGEVEKVMGLKFGIWERS